MKKLPIGVQTFQKIRENDYVYVDKTQKEALAQIQAKGKKIVLIGIGFSSAERNVTEFVWEAA